MSDKELYTAIFDHFTEDVETKNRRVYLKDVRHREGGLAKKKLIFTERVASKVIGTLAPQLTSGEYIAFLADIEFKNVEFKYPHGEL